MTDFTVVVSVKAADKDTKELKGSYIGYAMFKGPKNKKSCYRCGHPGHGSQERQFHEANCHKCGKVGYIAFAYHSTSSKEAFIHKK